MFWAKKGRLSVVAESKYIVSLEKLDKWNITFAQKTTYTFRREQFLHFQA